MEAMLAGAYVGLMVSMIFVATGRYLFHPNDPRPNACFWFVMITCPLLGFMYLILRHGVIPLCRALVHDAPTFFRFTV